MRLAEATTLRVGGPARVWREARTEEALVAGVREADDRGLPLLLLGGGSNLLAADAGFPGVVVSVHTRGVHLGADGVVEVAAGEPWGDVVDWAVARGLAGIECLAGIPGSAGATPVQNVGAYGQEVGDVLVGVRAWDRQEARVVWRTAGDLQLGYRRSILKGDHRYAVLAVHLRLRDGPPARPRHPSLRAARSVGELRDAVLAQRRARGMVLDPHDPDTRSAGSFFTNPVVGAPTAAAAADAARARGVAGPMPSWDVQGGVKLAAAWLLEAAGFPRGRRVGPVGQSRHHALALTTRPGATAAHVVELARELQRGVHDRLGVWLVPEPVRVGWEQDPLGPQG